MIRGTAVLCVMLMFAGMADAQDRFIGTEPAEDVLGAPKYPGAVYLRTINSLLDANHQAELYVTSDEPQDVIRFFASSLKGVRAVSFDEGDVRVRAFLVAPWIAIENDASRDDLIILDMAPNVQVKSYIPYLYESLVAYYESHEDFGEQLRAMDGAQTVIRYTHERVERDDSAEQLAGVWRNTARDQDGYFGAVIRFAADGGYRLEFTDGNIRYHAAQLASTSRYEGMDVEDIVRDLKARNPETGKFDILRNYITLSTENPMTGPQTKGGIVTVKSFSLTLQLSDMPVLTFIRQPD